MAAAPRHLKVTQEQYFATALEHLAVHGPESLTIGALCRALGVTSGSFYHYFRSWGGFVDALLGYWEADLTERVLVAAATQSGAEQRLEVLQREAVALPHEAEAAIRAWGRSEPKARQAQERVDARRIETVRSIIESVGVPPQHAGRLAHMGMAMLVGAQQMAGPVDVGMLRDILAEFKDVIRRHATGSAGSGDPSVPRQGG